MIVDSIVQCTPQYSVLASAEGLQPHERLLLMVCPTAKPNALSPFRSAVVRVRVNSLAPHHSLQSRACCLRGLSSPLPHLHSAPSTALRQRARRYCACVLTRSEGRRCCLHPPITHPSATAASPCWLVAEIETGGSIAVTLLLTYPASGFLCRVTAWCTNTVWSLHGATFDIHR